MMMDGHENEKADFAMVVSPFNYADPIILLSIPLSKWK
jgi:hypothetical protein